MVLNLRLSFVDKLRLTVVPSSLEAPTQRGLTERAGGIYKNILYKAMQDYQCGSREEWLELVDIAVMTRNRLLMRAGYSPIQRVIGYSPRLPGGLLSDGERDHMSASLVKAGDEQATRAMRMRKAASVAFHAADCDQALRAAALGGPRRHQNYEVGQAVFFWRRGAGTAKKTRHSYWHGPGRVIMTSLPNAVWIVYNGALVKAAPERVRVATPEEDLSMSGWLRGISKVREQFEKVPSKGFVDITGDKGEIDDEDYPHPQVHAGDLRIEDELELPHPYPKRSRIHGPQPLSGAHIGQVLSHQEPPTLQPPHLPQPLPPQPPLPSQTTQPLAAGTSDDNDFEHGEEAAGFTTSGSGLKREAEEGDGEPAAKKSRMHLLELYYVHLQSLAKQRAKKEVKARDFQGEDAAKLQRAILREISNNLETKAYELLSREESSNIMRTKPEKIMESRYVLTKKPLEPAEIAKAESEGVLLSDQEHGPCKAKARRVMKGYSEEAALEVEFSTPQVSRDSVIFVLQVIASMGWDPGFLDFTQAFHSGDAINRELYCSQPREGIPGAHPDQLLRLLKTCYGLTDGPLAWYQHLARRLQRDFGCQPSKADPCVFLLHDRTDPEAPKLQGIVGVATDDLLHGGDDRHWTNVAQIAKEYKLGKNQVGAGRFTGKDIKKESDGSISVNQAFYVKEKVFQIPLSRKRKQQRYSKCTASEVEQLRSSLGALSWLAKETRCDLAGKVALLQQSFPVPKVGDLVEANKIALEAQQHSQLGLKIMPIPWRDLRVSVVTDAAWGNARESAWLEDHPDDHWEETETAWIRHHVQPRRTSYHPAASPDGPDPHHVQPSREIHKYTNTANGIDYEVVQDEWNHAEGIRVLQELPWTGRSVFLKNVNEGEVTKVHSSLVQLQSLSSQGGQIVIYHHRSLSQDEKPAMTTVASWRSCRLKRKTVDTLAAEGQALQSGVGAVHWHRLMLLEAFHGMFSPEDWRSAVGRVPFLAAVDSKSLFDAVNKCASTATYVSDKRTAIDLSVIKTDQAETSGTVRWIDTRAMISDPLTKHHPGSYLRHVLSTGYWSIMEEGHALHAKMLERQGEAPLCQFYLTVWEFRV